VGGGERLSRALPGRHDTRMMGIGHFH